MKTALATLVFWLAFNLSPAWARPHYHLARYNVPSRTNSPPPAATPPTVTATPGAVQAYPNAPYFNPNPAKPAPLVAPPVDPEAEAEHKTEIAQRVLDWHRDQAEHGSEYAQYEMGLHYLNGDGVSRDLSMAKYWFLKAARQGNDDAYEKLKNTDDNRTVTLPGGRCLSSADARMRFMAKTGFPSGRPGYVIEFLTPIREGGSVAPENMTWEKIADARAAERWDEATNPPSATPPATPVTPVSQPAAHKDSGS